MFLYYTTFTYITWTLQQHVYEEKHLISPDCQSFPKPFVLARNNHHITIPHWLLSRTVLQKEVPWGFLHMNIVFHSDLPMILTSPCCTSEFYTSFILQPTPVRSYKDNMGLLWCQLSGFIVCTTPHWTGALLLKEIISQTKYAEYHLIQL